MVFGTALALISLQIIFGSRNLWLPAIVRNRQFRRQRSILSYGISFR
ncbi:exopolysaccharide biosynthesis protein [Rhizobium sp. 007]|nr:exopolysaccharide biosynthesis protein [Rhizobium sp. 007]